jgi:hypothetical protein
LIQVSAHVLNICSFALMQKNQNQPEVDQPLAEIKAVND